MSITDLVRRMFRKAAVNTQPRTIRRSRLNIEQLEDRTNPTTVTVSATGFVSEAGATATVTFTRDNTSGSLAVAYSYASLSTTASEADYTITGSGVFADGESTTNLTISAVDDATVEGTENLNITLFGFLYTVGSPGSVDVPVIDNDTPQVSVTNLDGNPTEGGSKHFRISRTGSTSGNLSVNFTAGGSATSGTDYTSIGTSTTITSGNSYVDVTVASLADNLVEGNETATITITDGGSAYTAFGSGATASMTITDDPPIVTVAFVNDAVEDGTNGRVRFTRSGGNTSSSLSVTYTISGSSTATSTTDYTSLSGSATIPASSTTADLTIHALKDLLEESDETVIVVVSSTVSHTAGSPSSATVTVIDTTLLPLASDAWITTDENTPAEISPLDAVINLDDDALTVSSVSQGDHGTVTIDGDTVTYTPDTAYVGDDSFTYTVEDEGSNEYTGTILVTVFGVMAPPFSVWTALNTAVNIDAAAAGYDPDDDTLSVTAVTQGSHGTVTIETDGTVTYTPNTSFTGDDSFTYTVEDGDGNESTNTITVSVSTTETVALDTDASTDVNTAVVVNVLDSAFSTTSATLTVSAVTQGSHGTVTDNLDGTVTYTPNTSFSGTDTFTYSVTDGASNNSTATVTMTVGAAAASAVDDIVTELAGVEEEIASPDEDSPANLATAWSAISGLISSYLSDTSAIVSATNIEATGADLSFEEFAADEVANYKILKLQYDLTLLALDAARDAASASKAALDAYWTYWKALTTATPPDKAQIATGIQVVSALIDINGQLQSMRTQLGNSAGRTYIKTFEMYNALKKAMPDADLGPAPVKPPGF